MEKDKITPLTLVEYLEDANNNLFETDFIGAEVYRSDDGGQKLETHPRRPLEQMHFTYGYYFSNIRCMPDNADQGVPHRFFIIRSDDGGKTWKSINGDNVHVDHHALWLDPARPGHLVNGNDGGLNISWDNGESWMQCNNPPVGQFYAIAVDEAEPYNVYGGAQDNGVWVGPSNYKALTLAPNRAATPTSRCWAATGCRCRWIPATTTRCTPAFNLAIISGSTNEPASQIHHAQTRTRRAAPAFQLANADLAQPPQPRRAVFRGQQTVPLVRPGRPLGGHFRRPDRRRARRATYPTAPSPPFTKAR